MFTYYIYLYLVTLKYSRCSVKYNLLADVLKLHEVVGEEASHWSRASTAIS